jgi:hypothetical protein
MGHRYRLQPRELEGGAHMIYESEFAEDIYDAVYCDASVDDDDMDAGDAGFMHGYLGKWRGF